MESTLKKIMTWDEVSPRYLTTLPDDCYFEVDGDARVVRLFQFVNKGNEWLYQ